MGVEHEFWPCAYEYGMQDLRHLWLSNGQGDGAESLFRCFAILPLAERGNTPGRRAGQRTHVCMFQHIVVWKLDPLELVGSMIPMNTSTADRNHVVGQLIGTIANQFFRFAVHPSGSRLMIVGIG